MAVVVNELQIMGEDKLTGPREDTVPTPSMVSTPAFRSAVIKSLEVASLGSCLIAAPLILLGIV